MMIPIAGIGSEVADVFIEKKVVLHPGRQKVQGAPGL